MMLKSKKWLPILMTISALGAASVTTVAVNVERHPERNFTKTAPAAVNSAQLNFIINSDESELNELYKAAAKLEVKKEKLPKDSSDYVDLDKNLADIYARMHLAEKYLNKVKSSSNENFEKVQSDFEFLLTDVREIINWNAQPSE